MELKDVLNPHITPKAIASSVGADIVVVSRLDCCDETPSIWPHTPSQSQEAVRKRGNSKRGASAPIKALEKPRVSLAKVKDFLLTTEQHRGDTIVKIKQAHRDDTSADTLESTPPVDSDPVLRRILFLRAKTDTNPQAPPSIEEVSTDLLRSLMTIRKKCPERPIVFIGHNIGVVVVERALIKSSSGDSEEGQIFRRTAGIIYLSSNDPKRQPRTKMISDYFGITGRMTPNQANLSYKESNDRKYFEKHLEDLRALLEKADNIALEEAYRAGSFKSYTRPSAISLFRHSYLDGTKRARKVMLPGITEAILASLNCYRLLSAACKNNVEELQVILADGVNVNSQDRNGNTALHVAASTGHTETVKVLLLDYEANVTLQNANGRSALSFVVNNERNNLEVVKLLLKRGARLKEKEKGDLSNLPRASQKIKDLLENPPFIEGPQEYPNEKVWQTPIAPRSALAQAACHSSRAVVAEIFKTERREEILLEEPTIDDLLYKIGPQKISHEAGKRAIGKILKETGFYPTSKCLWYHVPANNVSATS